MRRLLIHCPCRSSTQCRSQRCPRSPRAATCPLCHAASGLHVPWNQNKMPCFHPMRLLTLMRACVPFRLPAANASLQHLCCHRIASRPRACLGCPVLVKLPGSHKGIVRQPHAIPCGHPAAGLVNANCPAVDGILDTKHAVLGPNTGHDITCLPIANPTHRTAASRTPATRRL